MARRLRRPSAEPFDPESAAMQSCARTSEKSPQGVEMDKGRMAVAATMIALSAPVFAQQPAASPPPPVDFSKVEIKTINLGNNCYMLQGEGGNITVAVAKDGIIMVDGQYAPLHDKIKAAIEAISKQPIKYLVNTHYHEDPTGTSSCAAVRHLYELFQDQAQRPRRRPQARPECAYRRRHLCLVQDRQRAVDRRYLHQRPLSQYRFRQWRTYQWHDRRH